MAEFGNLISREDSRFKFLYFTKHGRSRLFMFGKGDDLNLFCRVICDLDEKIESTRDDYEGFKTRGDLIFVNHRLSYAVFDWGGNTVATFDSVTLLDKFMDIYDRGYASGIERGRSYALDGKVYK